MNRRVAYVSACMFICYYDNWLMTAQIKTNIFSYLSLVESSMELLRWQSLRACTILFHFVEAGGCYILLD